MVLVPGGTVALGWDAARPLGLTAAQRAAVDAEPDAGLGFEEMLSYYCAPARTVTLAPFLLEIEPCAMAPWRKSAKSGTNSRVQWRLPHGSVCTLC
jgi:hypothetical protein